MKGLRPLSEDEMKETKGGEAITLAGLMAILAVAIVIVVVYRLFGSAKGKVSIPGGFRFEWGK